MNRTPLLRPLRDNGATLYVFPSASEDIGLNLNSRATGVALSHYALLNLPNLMGKTTHQEESMAIAEDLQNYVMNFETLLLNQDSYNYQEYHTVSERVFWHWLIKKLNKVNLTQTLINNDQKESNVYFRESYENKLDRVVQCFGSIDAGNSLSTEFGMFNETYINIPTSYANGPVFFKHVQDASESNYIFGKSYNVTNRSTLEGRDQTTIDSIKILTNSSPIADNNDNTTYYATDAYEIVKDCNQIQQALREFLDDKDIIINSYDDINVDSKENFKETVYDITSNPIEFGFNAILLYYSVYDQDDITKSAYATNLFGIIFLDSPKATLDDKAVIECLSKKKSYGATNAANFFGNSYSFRVNIKTMSVYDNTDAIIQDNTTMSSIASTDFSDVISNLNRAIDTMNTNVQTTMAIQDSYMNILHYYDEQRQNIKELNDKVNGFINGSKTSSFNADLLRTNEIRPEDISTNTIKITLNRRQNDYIDNALYHGTTYIPPIVITNDYSTFNVPTVYKPVMDVAPTAQGEWYNTIGNVQDIIDKIEIKYYTYAGKTYQQIELPGQVIKGYGLDHLYKTGADLGFDKTDETLTNVQFINYDALIPLLITYIKNLKTEIEELKQR